MTKRFPIVGLDLLSLVHYPGLLSAVVKVPGCNFRCPFCKKEDLVLHHQEMDKIPEDDVIETLYPRIGFLGGVCITGGEPTLHRFLPDFCSQLRTIGAKIKVETNGSRPRNLKRIIDRRRVDYISLDIKAPLKRYREITRYKIQPSTIEESIKLIRQSSIDHDFHVTVIPGIHDREGLLDIAQTLAGSKRLILERYEPGKAFCPPFSEIQPYSEDEMKGFRDLMTPYFGETILNL